MNRRDLALVLGAGAISAALKLPTGLAAQSSTAIQSSPRPTIGMIVHPDMILLDLAGPLTVFSLMQADIRLVAAALAPMPTDVGIAVQPNSTYENCQRDEVSAEIDKAASKCANDLKPLQDAADGAVTLATGGLNKLLPERMTHIEIGEIIAGKPLGGEGALVPHFREQILGAIGLKNDRGFVTTWIKDPIRCTLFLRKC
jgi:hypothetical protein